MLTLYDYWHSSSAYRVRIALNLKALEYRQVPVSLIDGQQQAAEYRRLNPQGLVPLLIDGDMQIAQSVAICEYLEDTGRGRPLLPQTPETRARARQLINLIACDTQPLNNLRVLNFLGSDLGMDEGQRSRWYAHWITQSFDALEHMLPASDFSCGEQPMLPDCFIVPQVYNALRFDVDISGYPKINALYARCNALSEFERASPAANKPG